MKKQKHLFFLLIFFSIFALAQNSNQEWTFKYKPISGSYEIYGGELDDPKAPDGQTSNIAIKIDGVAAKNIFQNLGKDIKNACTSENDERVRIRNNITCYFSRKDAYSCYIGFDLKTGKNKSGVIC